MKSNSPSGAIVYSFNGRWIDALRSGSIRVFFRKRRPIRLPRNVFVYVGVPVKKIIGHAPLERVETVTLGDARLLAERGGITEHELRNYIGDGSVYAIFIGRIRIYSEPVDLGLARAEFDFNPPQSFSIVSPEFERYLMEVN